MTVNKISYNDLRTCSEVLYHTKDEDRLQVVETDQILFVGSKVPNIDNLGLEDLNIKIVDEGTIITDVSYQTSVPNIYAAGDVIGQPALASASFLQGRLASVNMFGNRDDIVDGTRDMPYGIYSIPEISGIGFTEKQAVDLGLEVTVGRAYYKSMTRASLNHDTDGMLKLVFRNDNLKLVGVHIIGEQASEMVHIGQAVMAFDGDIKYFIERVLNYPTYAEAYKIAAFNGLNRLHKSGVKYKKILDKK
jgi:NAD(P) transhydrogenase